MIDRLLIRRIQALNHIDQPVSGITIATLVSKSMQT